MKERRLKILVAVMAIAVIGLLSVQFYWMSNIIRVEEERFNKTVGQVLSKTAELLEKKEAADAVMHNITGNKKNVMVIIENGTKDIGKNISKDRTHKIRFIREDTSNANLHYEVRYFGNADSSPSKVKVYKKALPNSSQSGFAYKVWNDKIDTVLTSRKKLVQNVVTELVDVNTFKPIEKRTSVSEIESVLSNELRNAGINTEFYFGVTNPDSNKLALVKSGTDISELQRSNLRASLFPNELFAEHNQLIVYFPHQESYLLGTVAGMLALSVGFIFLTVFVFYKTVEMFLRQKKITAIKNDLINNITHEFKTPISTIAIACEALTEPKLADGKNSVERYSKIIGEENNHLKLMVDALLTTASMEKGELNINKVSVNLHEIIEASSAKFQHTLYQKNGKIELNLSADKFTIEGDAFHLANIFSNLIDNAIKYNEQPPVITITTKNEADTVVVTVRDNGIGIPKEHLGKIFDTFFRVVGGNIQDVRGNGIGLSYTKKIIEELGGQISVQSEIEKGSEFTITFPIKM